MLVRQSQRRTLHDRCIRQRRWNQSRQLELSTVSWRTVSVMVQSITSLRITQQQQQQHSYIAITMIWYERRTGSEDYIRVYLDVFVNNETHQTRTNSYSWRLSLCNIIVNERWFRASGVDTDGHVTNAHSTLSGSFLFRRIPFGWILISYTTLLCLQFVCAIAFVL